MKFKLVAGLCFWLAVLGVLAGDGPVPELADVKTQLENYHDSGRYLQQLEAVIQEAQAFVAQRYRQVEKPAIVLDVDETALSNWPEIIGLNFGFDRDSWDEWIAQKKAWAITPTLNMALWAQANGVAVFFVTGRKDFQKAATAENLESAGYRGWVEIYCKPSDRKIPFAALFKSAARRKISEAGYHIVANIGDQQSDLDGGFAEATFKLPNPFYRVP